jgi:hypothetical protein
MVVGQMREAIVSLSLVSDLIIPAVLSVAVVWFLCSKFPIKLYPVWILGVPFAIAYIFYWLPVWLGSDDVSQYGAWAFLGVGMLFRAGFFPSAFLALLLRKHRQRREHTSQP